MFSKHTNYEVATNSPLLFRVPNMSQPGVAVADLCVGSDTDAGERACLDLLLPELSAGRHLVVLDDLDSAELEARIPRLNELAQGEKPLGVYLVNDAEAEERSAFFWRWAPAFELREAPLGLLRPLYRTLPRVFLVEDGVVETTWSGYPPAGEV